MPDETIDAVVAAVRELRGGGTMIAAFLATVADLDALDKTDELCCVFARDWTRRVYGDAPCARAPLSLWHLFADCGDPWGPVTACVQAGLTTDHCVYPTGAMSALTPNRYHRGQGWRGKPFAAGVTGHTITVLAGPDGWAIVYDSAKDPRGARVTLVRWADYAKQYTGGIALAVLREP